MRSIYFFLFLSIGLFSGLKAQVNIASARANPKTFIFDDEKHTVHGYIYSLLKEQTSCCSNDAIYLEVKFDEAGYVTSAKTLTGKNDCYRKSIEDIVKNVRWDATGVKGSKTIYFEVKPIIQCSGGGSENQYKPIAVTNNPNFGGVASSNTVTTTTTSTPVVTTTAATTTKPVTTATTSNPVVTTNNNVKEDDNIFGNNGDESSSEDNIKVTTTTTTTPVATVTTPKTTATTTTTPKVAVTTTTTPKTSSEGFLSENTTPSRPKTQTTTTTSTPRTSGGKVSVPPQATDVAYNPKGDRKPEVETHENLTIQTVSKPTFATDESTMAVNIKKELRTSGYCGVAQAAIEVTVSPSGTIVGHRILYTNSPKIDAVIPAVTKSFKFGSKSIRYNYTSIIQFKTDIICGGQGTNVNLDDIPDVIQVPSNL